MRRIICVLLALLSVPAIAAAQRRASQRGSRCRHRLSPARRCLRSACHCRRLACPSRGPEARPGHQRDWQQKPWQPPNTWEPPRDWNQQELKPTGRPPSYYYGQSKGYGNRFRHQGPAVVYVGSLYGGYPYYGTSTSGYYDVPPPGYGVPPPGTAVPGVITVVPEPLSGQLLLEVEPANILQVFVDGAYVGTPADLGGVLDLQPGSHRIEFRGPGYRSLTIDAQIVSQRTIVYRARLEPTAPTRVVPPPAQSMPPPAVPIEKRTMYLIPGCYMGNVPPQDLRLPAGCDVSRMTTIRP